MCLRAHLVQFLVRTQHCNKFTKGPTKATGAVFFPLRKPQRKRHLEGSGGEAVEALSITGHGSYQKRGRLDSSGQLDSSVGTTSPDEGTDLAGSTLRVHGLFQQANALQGCLPPPGPRGTPLLPAGFCPCYSGGCRVLRWRSSGKRAPPGSPVSAEGSPEGSHRSCPKLEATRSQGGAFCLRSLGPPKLGTGFLRQPRERRR